MSEPTRRTLFGLRLSDPRDRRQLPGGRVRGGRRRFETSSDVRRGRLLAVTAAAAAIAVAVAWWLVPAPPTPASGALALPHRSAGLTCTSCHKSDDQPAASACVGCHGPHPSQRPAHRALAAEGKLGCASCHDVHGSDQGVRFVAQGPHLRYGVTGESAVASTHRFGEDDVTVPLVPLARCAPCHDERDARDPIARCVLGDPERGAFDGCFDEHRPASLAAPERAGGVCSAQHGVARYAAWEAAREVALAEPAPATGGRRDAAWWWLGSAGLAALVSAGALGGVRRLRRSRRSKPAEEAPALRPAERVRLPQIDESTCLGCYACVDACPYDVLAIDRYVAKVVRPEACCGLILCEQVCPNGSLRISDGAPIDDRPALSDTLESLDTVGVYLAGDITGLPLIKNAIVQGSRAVGHIAAALPARHGAPLDLLIVGAGPAGISAALEAKERGLSFRVIEQETVAHSIKSFPRGKLVFDQPLELPLAGKLWLEESTKEELLVKWTRIVREARLPIDEGRRLVSLERAAAGFVVQAADREDPDRRHSYRAARVLLAIGVRGSPRKLEAPIAAEVENKVHYHLADARSFAGTRVLVVGLGDAAMETAIALAHQPGTEVTISYRGERISRGKARNTAELERLLSTGRVRLVSRSTVARVARDAVTLRTPRGEERLVNDAVFVMIGSVPPTALLEALGVGLTSSRPR